MILQAIQRAMEQPNMPPLQTKVPEPICGMAAADATTLQAERSELTSYFCHGHSRKKFLADPVKAKSTQETHTKAICTCPMHPEVRQDHVGSCPMCGTVLEPADATAGSGRSLSVFGPPSQPDHRSRGDEPETSLHDMMKLTYLPSPRHQVFAFLGWLALCFTAAGTAAFLSPDGWYAGINKPTWNPPAWVFGPAWTFLYVTMAVAAWLVWREGGWRKQGQALGLFVVQWALNALWTPLFFGLHRPGLALIDILAMWLAILATLIAFWRVRRVAGILLLPYLAWVTFATALNFTIWRMNS